MTLATKKSKSQRVPQVFLNLTFVVSNTEDIRIADLIKQHGGKVQKSLTGKTNYFVQGYNTDDDDRLGEAGDKDIRVISPEYINACTEAGELLDINTQALGLVDDKDGFPACMYSSAVAKCFNPPGTECREREELPQSFGEFLKTEKYTPSEGRKTIYLVPLHQKSGKKRLSSGELKANKNASEKDIIEKISDFLSTFFCMPTSILPALTLKIGKTDATFEAGKYNYSIAVHCTAKQSVRLDAMEIITALEEIRPKDGFCILGITPEEIYEDLNDDAPLLGRSTGDQAGILSTYYHNKTVGCPKQKQHAKSDIFEQGSTTSLRALFNTAAHEAMHMFGLDHCAYYSCIMNSWSDPLADPKEHPEKVAPLHLCPVDLRKLQYTCGFNAKARYNLLLDFYTEMDIQEEVKWIQEILKIMDKETN